MKIDTVHWEEKIYPLTNGGKTVMPLDAMEEVCEWLGIPFMDIDQVELIVGVRDVPRVKIRHVVGPKTENEDQT